MRFVRALVVLAAIFAASALMSSSAFAARLVTCTVTGAPPGGAVWTKCTHPQPGTGIKSWPPKIRAKRQVGVSYTGFLNANPAGTPVPAIDIQLLDGNLGAVLLTFNGLHPTLNQWDIQNVPDGGQFKPEIWVQPTNLIAGATGEIILTIGFANP